MANTRNHGGMCCGASHIFNINPYDLEYIEEQTNNARNKGHMLEMVLINQQVISMSEVVNRMLELGWKRTAVWYNRNSGNYCNQFVFHRNAQRNRVINLDNL